MSENIKGPVVEPAKREDGDGFVPSDALTAAIESRVESEKVASEAKKEKTSRTKKTREISSAEARAETVDPVPEPEPGAKGKEGEPEKKAESDPVEVPDSLIERAVKAGMSISDARAFKDVQSLERITGILEQRAKPADEKKEEDKETPAIDLKTVVAEIPDELDPEVYDENFIKLAKAFKQTTALVSSLQAEIEKLNQSSLARSEQSWFEGQIASLGEDAVKSIDAGKKTALETKLKVLEAGYKAAGQTVKRDEVFKEAAKLVLGDIEKKDEKAATAGRKDQFVSRPASQRAVAAQDPREGVINDVRNWKERNVA